MTGDQGRASSPTQQRLPRREDTAAARPDDRAREDRDGRPAPRDLNVAIQTFASVCVPTTIVTALAFYFGVQRQAFYTAYFGIDSSLLGFSTQDYLFRSTDVLYRALVLIALAALAALQLHVLITKALARAPACDALRWAARAAGLLSTGFSAFGAVAMFRSQPFLFGPVSLGLGVGVGAYSVHLGRRIGAARKAPARRTREERRLAAASTVLVGLLIVLSLFWATKDVAEALGRGSGMLLASHLRGRPSAVVYSGERLLLGGPGVHEEWLDTTDAVYRFRYSGLRLLVRSGGNYFLLPDGWTRRDGSAIVLPDSGALRLEFTPGTS